MLARLRISSFIRTRDGWSTTPEELLANIRSCLDAAGAVDSIGIDNQGESCLAWDAETGKALSPVIVWQDNRTADAVARLKDKGAASLTLLAGLVFRSTLTFRRRSLPWIVNNTPAARDALSAGRLRLGTTDAFFLHRLTGHSPTDVTTASRTSLMNLETGRWDQDLMRSVRRADFLPA